MQRNGFTLCPDGSAMQLKVPNSPAIPQRKVKVSFIQKDGSVSPRRPDGIDLDIS